MATNDKKYVGTDALDELITIVKQVIEGKCDKEALAEALNKLNLIETGGDGYYISAISQVYGKLHADRTAMDITPISDSQRAITSGGVYVVFHNLNERLTADESNISSLQQAVGYANTELEGVL